MGDWKFVFDSKFNMLVLGFALSQLVILFYLECYFGMLCIVIACLFFPFEGEELYRPRPRKDIFDDFMERSEI